MTFFNGGEPDFLAVRPPRQTTFRFPFLREAANVSRKIGDRDDSPIVPECWMIHERDLIAPRGEADVADPSAALIQHSANGKLQPASPGNVVNDSQLVLG